MSFVRAITALAALVAVSACAAPEPVVSAPPTTSTPTLAAPPPSSVPAPSGPAVVDDAVLPPSPVVVHFAHGKADITGSTMQVLWGIAPALKAANPAVIRVQGFTDTSGKAAYNRILSEKRAQAVADQLRKLGITARVEVSGQGIVQGGKKGRKDASARKVEISWDAPASAKAAAVSAPAPMSSDTVKAQSGTPEGAVTGLALAAPAAPVAEPAAYGIIAPAAEASPGAYWAAPFEATGPPVLS